MYGESEIEALVRQTLNRAVTPVDWEAYVALYDDPWGPSPYSTYEDRALPYSPHRGDFGVVVDDGEIDVARERHPEDIRRPLGTLKVGTNKQGERTIAIV